MTLIETQLPERERKKDTKTEGNENKSKLTCLVKILFKNKKI